MSDRGGRRGGHGGRYQGGGGDRGRGRGRGRGELRLLSSDEARRVVEETTRHFKIGPASHLTNVDHPTAPKYAVGRVGRSVGCLTNYFEIQSALERASHYRVEFTACYDNARDILKKVAELKNWPDKWAFDGRHDLYIADEFLPNETFDVETPFQQGRREITVVVTLTPTSVVDMRPVTKEGISNLEIYPSEAVRVLDVVLSHAVSNLPDLMLHRRSVFTLSANRTRDIGYGAEAWLGYHQSVKACQGGLFLNMDSACTPFYKAIEVTQFIKDILSLRDIPRRLDHQQIRVVRDTMKGLMIHTIRGHRKAKVIGIGEAPRDMKFHYSRDNEEISVQEYYRRVDQPLRYPDLPCLDCSKGKKPCFLPPECATIAPAQFVTKINERHQEGMIKFSTQRPSDKKSYLESLANSREITDTMNLANPFGLTFGVAGMTSVRARIINPPLLAYKESACASIGNEGQWNLSSGNVNFLTGRKLKSWALVSLCNPNDIERDGPNGLRAFLVELSRALSGLMVSHEKTDLSRIPIIHASQNDSLTQVLNQAKEQAQGAYENREPSIILVLMPRRVTYLYKAIKHASDQVICIPTQCFAADKAGIGGNYPPRGRPQYCGNLAMKINAKVGGSNWSIMPAPCGVPVIAQNKPFMMIGADVSHPVQRSSFPSIAAVVGSFDPGAARYFSRITYQPSREEIVLAMKDSVQGLLREFYEYNKKTVLPESIIVFRDGVSEGFFSKVVNHEYKAIVEACKEMNDIVPNYRPFITFIIIQKRHHTRLFPDGSPAHHSGNVLPGTVVDSTITSPFGHNFYLCSQAGIQGTVRPAHYHVLIDENNYGSDAIQVMCYWMCYMSCRCTKSTSVPAPAIYAHLAAMRGRILTGEETDDEASAHGGVSGTGGHPTSGDIETAIASYKNKMYYV